MKREYDSCVQAPGSCVLVMRYVSRHHVYKNGFKEEVCTPKLLVVPTKSELDFSTHETGRPLSKTQLDFLATRVLC